MGNKNAEGNSLSNMFGDDLDFNIEEVEQVIAPQIDGDDSDDDNNSVTESRKIWCC